MSTPSTGASAAAIASNSDTPTGSKRLRSLLAKGPVKVRANVDSRWTQSRNGVSVIPSSIDLSGADIELSGVAGREFLLKEAIAAVKDFDYVLIDCPPNLGLLTLNALTSADEVYIPVQAEFLALQGMSKLLETIEVVKKRLNGRLTISGVLATRFDGRKNLNNEVVERIASYFGDRLFQTRVRDNVSLAEAPSHGQSIFEYAPRSYGAEDYERLCREIVEREGKHE